MAARLTQSTAPTADRWRSMFPERSLQWQDYADGWLDFPLGDVLDFGCGNGAFLDRIAGRCRARWGVDIDAEQVAAAQANTQADIRHIQADDPLPFADGSFDTVILVEVIEHVADERAVLREIARVLRIGGHLLLTTPHKGLLTFLDPGNVKFVAPRLHRFIHCTVLRRQDYYEQRFGATRQREQGMTADFTIDQRPWHRHYRYSRIRALAPAELETVAWVVYFTAFRALWSLQLVLRVLTCGRISELPRPLRWCNKCLSRRAGALGDQLVVLFQKRA